MGIHKGALPSRTNRLPLQLLQLLPHRTFEMSTPSSKWIKVRRTELATKSTSAESAAFHNLHRLGYTAVRQKPIWTGRKMYFADLYVPKLKLIIECDGGYHYTKRQKRLDSNRSSGLRRLGYHVVRLSNRDARDIQKVKAKIALILRRNS